MNPLDSAFEFFAPLHAERRFKSRRRLEAYKALQSRAYDGAAKGRRTAGWVAPSTSAVGETEFALETLRNRSRELVRNNPWAAEAIRIWSRHAIGDGWKVKPTGTTPRQNKRAVDLWKAWAESTEIDPEGKLAFSGLCSLAIRELVESGEFLIRRRFRKKGGGLAVPIQLQLLEADHLDTTKRLEGRRDTDRARVIQGVQYSLRGRVQGYWLYPFHPGDSYSLRRESAFVDAKDIIHCFRPERIGQTRGIPWGASAMLRHRKLDQYEDAELERKVIASMFVGFVHDIEAGMGSGALPGQSSTTDLVLEPGTWEELPAGKDITFSKPPEVEGYRDYMEISLLSIARAYSVTYEDLTGDLSKVNFSSARIGRIEHADEVKNLGRNVLLPQLFRRVWSWFVEAGRLDGSFTLGKELTADWTAPPPRLADPKTDVGVANLRVRAGFSSLSNVIREFGFDPEEVLSELAGDLELLDKLGLTLDSDPRSSTSSGAPREDSGAGIVGDVPAEPGSPGAPGEDPPPAMEEDALRALEAPLRTWLEDRGRRARTSNGTIGRAH